MVTHIHFMMMEPSMPFSSGLYKKEGEKEESKEIVIRFLPFRHGAHTRWCRLLDQFTNKKFLYSIEYICSEHSEAGFAHFSRRSLSIFQCFAAVCDARLACHPQNRSNLSSSKSSQWKLSTLAFGIVVVVVALPSSLGKLAYSDLRSYSDFYGSCPRN